ncbi:MAG: tetratricopeptide repeat protein [Pyrinomonadaceae bacterium]|nr:tetratricopeptide repeat protein [Pyrinomonadaceae bacterium]
MTRRYYRSLVGILVVAAAMSLPIVGQSKRDKERARQLTVQAANAYREKNYREAADKYAEVIAILPNNPNAHYAKGSAHVDLKEYDAALNEFTLAMNKGFRPILAIYKIRAFVYNEQKNYDAAAAELEKGLAIAPKDLQVLKDLAGTHINRKAYTQALDVLNRAARIAPQDADVNFDIARVYYERGDFGNQRTAAETALAKGTRFPGEAYFLLGDACRKQNNTPCAIDAYQKSANAKPDNLQTYRTLAEIFQDEYRFPDAINILKQGLKAFPANGYLYTDLGRYYSFDDRPNDAIQAAKSGIHLLPKQSAAYTNLCRAYNETKAYDLAVKECNTALLLKPGDGETYFYLGNANVGQGRTVEANKLYAQAVKGLEKLTATSPNLSENWYLLGNAYFADRQTDKAIEAYTRCLSISPKFLKARFNLGIAQIRKKNRAAAMEQYERILPVDADLAARLKGEIDRM